MNKKWSLLLAVLLVVSMVLSACGGSGTNSTSSTTTAAAATAAGTTASSGTTGETQYQDTLTTALTTDAGTLNPFQLNSRVMKLMARPILETLIYFDETGKMEMILADHYEYNADATGITFYLKKGVKFHNGEELTSEDVKYTIEGYANGNTKSDVAQIDVKNIKIIDKYTIYLPAANGKPNATLHDYVKNIQIVNKKFMETAKDTKTFMVGTGPYKLVEYVTGDHLTYEKNEDYYGKKTPTKKLVQRFITEPSVAMVELESGNVDVVFEALAEDIKRVASGEVKGMQTLTGPYLNEYFVAFNNGSEPFNNIKVRQAVAYALNKEDIRTAAFNEFSEVTQSCIPSASIGFDKKWLTENPYAYNVDKAKSLLAEAGYPNGLEVSLLSDGGSFYAQMADQMIYQLAKAGITVKLEQFDTATVNNTLFKTNDWDMVLRNYTSPGMPMSSLELYGRAKLSGLNGSVCTRIDKDPNGAKFESLLDEVVTIPDETKRNEKFAEIQQMEVDNLWWIPIVSRTAVGLARDNVKGAFASGAFIIVNKAYAEVKK